MQFAGHALALVFGGKSTLLLYDLLLCLLLLSYIAEHEQVADFQLAKIFEWGKCQDIIFEIVPIS